MTYSRALFLLSLLVAGCKEKAPEAPPASGSAASPGSAVAPAAGGTVFDKSTFVVKSTLPGPTKKEKPLETEAGQVMQTFYSFRDPNDASAEQVVQFITVSMPAGGEEAARQSAMDGMMGALKATVDDKRIVTVAGTDMLDFTAHYTDKNGTSHVRGRVAYKNGRMYQALALGKGAEPTPSTTIFVDSFSLK